jgi:hypothetical protein
LARVQVTAATNNANKMTLLLGIASPWGTWMSSDHRLTRCGEFVTDRSVKHLGLKAPDGEALLTYTGLGQVQGKDVSEWLRSVLADDDGGLENVVQHVADRATQDLGPDASRAGILHVFVVSAFLRNDPYVVLVANTDTPVGTVSPALTQRFKVHPLRVVAPVPIFAGGGVAAVSPADMTLLRETSEKRPRRTPDYLQLLASVNRRAASSRRRGAATVSSACVASYLSVDGGINTRHFDEKGSGSRIEEPPYLYFGLDFTDVIRNRPLWDPTTRQWRDKSGNVIDPSNWLGRREVSFGRPG